MVSPLFLVQIWCSRRRSRRLSALWATLKEGDGSSLLSPPLVWSLSLVRWHMVHISSKCGPLPNTVWVVSGPFQMLPPPSVWRVIFVDVGSLFPSWSIVLRSLARVFFHQWSLVCLLRSGL
ncbi:unnamed protein product [Brassica rapa subsp. trilocularis]